MGGMENASLILASFLKKNGHTPIVLTMSEAGALSTPPELQGVTIIRKPSLLRIFIESLRADSVIINGGSSLRAEAGCFFARKKPLIIHQMAVPVVRIVGGKLIRSLNFLRVFFSRRAYHLCVSHAVKKVVNIHDAHVCFNPIPEFFFKDNSPITSQTKKNDFLFIGRLYRYKGIYQFIEALGHLHFDGVDFQATICGKGEEESKIRSLIIDKKMEHKVNLITGLYGQELMQLYSSSRFLVLVPYGHLEGCPLVIGEAFSQGLPVIGSDQEAIIECIDDAGWVVSQNNVQELTLKLHEALMLESKDYSSISSLATKRALLFHPDHFCKSVINLLSEQIHV
ncbi:MAG: glycosyltransferase family 4 protein [Verrucomicrobiota bacterium]|nr:glycosyltransferase family 4 protein [Verrucomicrobiota bacterium]